MADFRLIEYAPIGLMFVVAGGFAASQLLVTQLIGPRKRTQTKLMPYECGKDPVGSAHDRFSVKFYSVAVDFLLFDLEVLFMIPFAVAFKSLIELENLSKGPAVAGVATAAGATPYATIALVSMLVFLAMVVIGFVYAWKKGTFDWSLQARAEAKAEAKALVLQRKKALLEQKKAA
ncbi:MAG TPA: NADH-quinone oxidoreductase subunit A [Pyrinomonadaceae bacterium]|nr:NADH-quinone oxidoreductase subunit A [Pyrinomonadaceae bacterium]